MISAIRTSLTLLAIFTLLLGVVYPVMVTAMAQFTFAEKSKGSLIEKDGKIIGSKLLGQYFSEPKYFWGRLSATAETANNAAASGGSNFGSANPKLLEVANVRMAALQKADPRNKSLIPVDLVTSSASGLDPHISIAAAVYQVPRVARARHMSEAEVNTVLEQFKRRPHLGFFGEPQVNVLELNLALDELSALPAKEKR